MKEFNYINKQYIPPVDLTTLNNTFNTLEQGHKEAIKSASELQTAMANLDLNEAENEWRQQKISEIQKTIDDNTIYGNSYAALDNIIAKAGNLASDQGMIGRLQAQKDFKVFRERVEKDDTLPQDYKDYYLENNPYYYKDKYDNNGNIIGSTKWEPINSPKKVIPLNQLIVQGINIAAKESGGGTLTRWIDVNGNVTTNPSEAFDGEVYNSSTNRWERLSKEKILQGINSMIESTPGAKESLQQDYDVALWKHDKLVKDNKSNELIIDDVTDENGITLSPQQYLLKRISPAVNAASYYNQTNNTSYGSGLKTYMAATKAAEQAIAQADEINTKSNDFIRGISSSTPITMKYDITSDLTSQKQNAQNGLEELFKLGTGRNVNVNMTNASPDAWKRVITKAYNQYKKDGASDAQLSDFIINSRKKLREYTEATRNYDNIIGNLNTEDKDKLDYVNRMETGGNFNPNNPYDKKLLKMINELYTNDGEYLDINIKNIDEYNEAINILNGDTKTGFYDLGFTTGQKQVNGELVNYIRLPKSNYKNIVLLANTMNTVNNNNSYYEILDKDYNNIDLVRKIYPSMYGSRPYNNNYLKAISDNFNYTKKTINKKINSFNPESITISHENLPYRTAEEAKINYLYDQGIIDDTKYNTNTKRIDKELLSKIVGHNFAQTPMFAVDEDDKYGTLKEQINSKDRIDIGNTIIANAGNKRVSYNFAHNAIQGSGINITIYPKLDEDGNPTGDPKTYFIPGLITSKAQEEFDNDPSTIASDKIVKGDAMKLNYILSESYNTPTLGYQQLKCYGNNIFSYKINNEEYPINRNSAVTIISNMEEYNTIKDNVIAGNINFENKNVITRLDESIKNIAKNIANSIGKPDLASVYYVSLYNDLGYNLNE